MADLDVTLLVFAALAWESIAVQMRSSVPAEIMAMLESVWVPQQSCVFHRDICPQVWQLKREWKWLHGSLNIFE